jgi:hypothetical protein
MPTENDNPAATAATTVDTVTPELKALKAELASLKKENATLRKANENLTLRSEEKKAEAEAGPEEDNYAVVNGKRYDVAGTVSARFATDEGRKGHLPHGLETELVILK